MLVWPNKDPDEVLDYQINWAGRLGDDTIVTSTWIIPDGITMDSNSFTDTTSTVWLSGGFEGARYFIQNRIVTLGLQPSGPPEPRTMDQSVLLKIKTK